MQQEEETGNTLRESLSPAENDRDRPTDPQCVESDIEGRERRSHTQVDRAQTACTYTHTTATTQ